MMMRLGPLTRREWLQFLGVGAAGYGVSLVIRANAPLGTDVSANPTAQALLHEKNGPGEGPSNADLRVTIFTDYQCPACRKAAPKLRDAFKADGRVQLRYKDWPILGERSVFAARMALAADRQGLYVPVHNALMRDPRRLDPPVLRQIAERSGARWSRIEEDLRVHDPEIDRFLQRNHRDAFALGVAGTPAFLIGPLLVRGALSSSQFARAFSQARRMKRDQGPDGG